MTKPKPPRPVRAWAPGLPDGALSVEQGQVPVFMSRKDAKFDCEMANDGSKPIRVTVVPDGATSAEAECRRLRRALSKIRAIVKDVRNPELNTCQECGDWFSTRDGCEDEGVCDPCAQKQRDAVREIIDAEWRRRVR